MDPDDEIFYGLDFEMETDRVSFTRAFDKATALAMGQTEIDESTLTKQLDQLQAFHFPATDSSQILPWSSNLVLMCIPALLRMPAQWMSKAWSQVW